jgi:hypothetical protein
VQITRNRLKNCALCHKQRQERAVNAALKSEEHGYETKKEHGYETKKEHGYETKKEHGYETKKEHGYETKKERDYETKTRRRAGAAEGA